MEERSKVILFNFVVKLTKKGPGHNSFVGREGKEGRIDDHFSSVIILF